MQEEEDYRRGSQDASALSHNFATLSASGGNNLAADAHAYGTFS